MVLRRRRVDHVHTLVPRAGHRYWPTPNTSSGEPEFSSPDRPRGHWPSSSAGPVIIWVIVPSHGDRGPGAEINAVSVLQPDLVPNRYLGPVDQRAVGRPGIQHGPVARRHRDQDGVQPADPRVGRRPGQVNLRREAAGTAPPPDPHLGSPQLEPPAGA